MSIEFPEVDYLASSGVLALGSRLKRFSEYLFKEVHSIYAQSGIDFEPRFFPLLSFLSKNSASGVVEIASAIGVTHAAVSQMLSPLQKAKLIKVSASSVDGRAKEINLTASGRALIGRLEPIWDRIRKSLNQELAASAPDFLLGLNKLERSFSTRSLAERTLNPGAAVNDIEILEWDPCYRGAFKDLNVSWILQLFGEIEQPDLAALYNPEKFIEEGGMIFFARVESVIVGTCLLTKKARGEFELAKMAVSALARGRGIGASLLDAAIEWARQQGGREITLETSSKLEAANRLYKRFKFIEDPERAKRSKYARVDKAYFLLLGE